MYCHRPLTMRQTDKRTLLRKLLQGDTNGLEALKQDQQRIRGVVVVDRMPDESSNEPVQASYTLSNGTTITELLTAK
jgi:hypothetical protein